MDFDRAPDRWVGYVDRRDHEFAERRIVANLGDSLDAGGRVRAPLATAPAAPIPAGGG